MASRSSLGWPLSKGFVHYARVRTRDLRIAPEALEQGNVQMATHRESKKRNIMRADMRQSAAPAWSARVPPTHFVGLRVETNSNLVRSVQAYRDELQAMDSQWPQWLVPNNRLHLTVGVMTLDRPDEQLHIVTRLLNEAASCMRPLRLRFNGLGTFGDGRVIFARPAADEHLFRLVKLSRCLRKALAAEGIDVKGNAHDDYTPHVTLAKVTPAIRREHNITVFPERMVALAKNDEMGASWFQRMDLCAMKESSDDGYWKIAHRAQFRTSKTQQNQNAKKQP
jgi:2'-5' RNA ligase